MNQEEFIKIKSIPVEQYPFTITFCLMSDYGASLMDAGEAARCIREGSEIYIYFSDYDLPVIVHELFHATEFIMGGIGQDISKPPNETWAYLIEYLMEETLEFLV